MIQAIISTKVAPKEKQPMASQIEANLDGDILKYGTASNQAFNASGLDFCLLHTITSTSVRFIRSDFGGRLIGITDSAYCHFAP